MQFDVMMIGPNGVGKTTLLATMYNEHAYVNTSKFSFKPEGDTIENLRAAYEQLEKLNDQTQNAPHTGLLPGEKGFVTHKFSIKFEKNRLIDLRFYDHKGGYLNQKKSELPEEFLHAIKDSVTFFNVIEGGVLMEGDDYTNKCVNMPTVIKDYLEDALDDKQKHLIVFVVTKCEKWLNSNRAGYDNLKRKFEVRHKPVLNAIRSRDNVVGVFVPVRTLGCVEFTEMVRTDNEPPYWKPCYTRKPGKFEPKFVEQPLCYMVAFLLNQFHENRNIFSKFGWWVTKKNQRYISALEHFANKKDNSYAVYGNKKLID